MQKTCVKITEGSGIFGLTVHVDKQKQAAIIMISNICEQSYSYTTSIAHRIKNSLRRTSEHIAIIYIFLNYLKMDFYA